MEPLQNILRNFARDFGIEGGAGLNAIRRLWIDLVGQTIAVHTYPDTIKNKVLTIIVDTPQWMHHLSFFKETIHEKLKSYNIGGIRFRLGKVPEKTDNQRQEFNAGLTDDDLRYIENTLKNLKDEELKEKFRVLITHGLTKGRKKRLPGK